jgi:hypothetical protein
VRRPCSPVGASRPVIDTAAKCQIVANGFSADDLLKERTSEAVGVRRLWVLGRARDDDFKILARHDNRFIT